MSEPLKQQSVSLSLPLDCPKCQLPVKGKGLPCSACSCLTHFRCVRNGSNLAIQTFLCKTCFAASGKSRSIIPTKQGKSVDDQMKSLSVVTSKSPKDLASRIDDLERDNRSLVKRCDVIEKRMHFLDSENNRMLTRLRMYEHKQCSQDLVISGIPDFKDEDPFNTVALVADAIQVKFSPDNVIDVYRVRDPVSKFRQIIVKFTSPMIRNQWIDCKRNKKELHANEINSAFPSTVVHINERLPSDLRYLLREARSTAKKLNFKYVWIRNGLVLMRKSDTSEPIKIKSRNELLNVRNLG